MTDADRPLFTPRLRLFLGGMVIANIAAKMEGVLLPLYIAELGANVGQVGLFFTLAAVAPLALQILGGWLSDSIGRLRAVAIGSVGGLIGYAVLFVAPSWEWLLIAAVTRAISHAFVAPSYQAFIAEEAIPEQMGRTVAISETVFRVVGVIGPPLGGLIALRYGFRAMFLTAGILYGTATVIRVLMSRGKSGADEARRRKKPTLEGLRNDLTTMASLLMGGSAAAWIFLTDGMEDITFELSNKLTPIYLEELIGLNTAQIGLLTSILSVCMMAFMALGGWISDRKGERVGICAGFGLYVIAQVVLITGKSFLAFGLVWALYGIGGALARPAFIALITKSIPQHLRGMAFGLFSTTTGLFSLPAPLVGALMWERIGPRAPFVVPMVGLLAVIPLVWLKLNVSVVATEDGMAETVVATD